MTYAAVILADSPVAYWPLEESGTTAGSVFADATGHGYDVSVVRGTFNLTTGPLAAGGTAPQSPADTTADALKTTVTAGLPYAGSAYSLEGWLLAAGVDGRSHNWITYGPAGFPFIGSAFITGSPTLLGSWHPANHHSFIAAPTWNYGLWIYVVLTDDAAGSLKAYVNATLQFTDPQAASNGVTYNASNFLFLGDPGTSGIATPRISGNQWYQGGLSNMAIYDYALSAAQVSAHYAAASAVPTPALRGGRGRIIQ